MLTLSFCASRLADRNKVITIMPSSERDVQECDARDDDRSNAAGFIIINKFTFLVAFQFQILKFNNFQAQND